MAMLRLTRISTGRHGTFGVLTVDGDPFCLTLEPVKHDNNFEKSCIPTGIYELESYKSDSYGDTFRIKDVPNRTNIIIHHGNTHKNTKGCIILGQYFGQMSLVKAVINSQKTINSLIFRLKNEKNIKLTIVEAF